MTHSVLSSFVSRGALAIAAAMLSACAAETPEDTDDLDAVDAEVTGVAEQAFSGCKAYRRGESGYVADATLWQATPTYNTGNISLIYTGNSHAGFRQALLYFDISDIPAGARIDSAVLYLSELYKASGTMIDLHAITEPWAENTVTWNNFNQAFDPTPVTTFFAWGGGTAQIRLEGLVKSWIDGEIENQGLLLQEPTMMASSFRSSEYDDVLRRPRLKVCYTTNP
ncbi:DNRLRE domain-containing protein [Chondromyces crocatus]|uniref:Carbohydrate-binding module family 96 domain-containing protein n=1 Tax=Chondromyces crocatus TaxID=52 RepID=A0A0K1EMJ1_CHOCO|nr:DNRLRE domain-containing protein [Chondromyces crocatus]AKT42115.1 uncharacterized protein CMC5_063380 [Chondromyces crocatus]